MNRRHFWLTKEHIARLETLLATNTHSKLRADDPRIIRALSIF